jgi:hypothetical protein
MTEVISNLSLITRLQNFLRILKITKNGIYRLFKNIPNVHIRGYWILLLKKSAEIKNPPESLKRLLEISDHDLCEGESEEKKTNLKKFLKLIDQVILDLSQEKTSMNTSIVEHDVTMSLKPYFNIEFLSFYSTKAKLDIQTECFKAIESIKQSKILNFHKCLPNANIAFGTKESLFYLNGGIQYKKSLSKTIGGYYDHDFDQIAIVKDTRIKAESMLIHELAHRYDEFFLTEKKRKRLISLYNKVCTYKDNTKDVDLKKGDFLPMYYILDSHHRIDENFTIGIFKNKTRFKAKQKELVFESFDSGFYYDGDLYPIFKAGLGGYDYFPSRYAKSSFYEWFAEMCTMITLNQNNVKDWITDKFLEIMNQGS